MNTNSLYFYQQIVLLTNDLKEKLEKRTQKIEIEEAEDFIKWGDKMMIGLKNLLKYNPHGSLITLNQKSY